MKNKNSIIAILILLTVSLGCRQIARQLKVDFLTDNNAAQKAAQAVRNKLGVSFKVQEIEIISEQFKMKIEAPDNPQNIDEYTYLGLFVSNPTPIQLNGNTRTLDKLPFEQIDFSVVPQIVKNALEKTQVEGGKVTKMNFLTYVGNKFGWDVTIQGTRESATARADMTGKIVGIDLSQTSRAANYKIFNETELTKATEAIKARFGENVQIKDFTIRENRLELKIPNPDNPQQFDSFTFGVSGLKKTPMPPISLGTLGDPFALNTVNLSDAVNLAQKAKERLTMPDGEVSTITIEHRRAFVQAVETSQLIWTVSIKRGAAAGLVNYDDKFNEISVRKD